MRTVDLSIGYEAMRLATKHVTSNIFLNCRFTFSFVNMEYPAGVPIGQSRMALIGKPTRSLSSNDGADDMMSSKSASISL